MGPGRAAAATGWRCSWRARTRSTSSSCASPRRCSAAASRRRSSTPRTRGSSTATCSRPRSRRRSTSATGRRSATPRWSGPRRSSRTASCARRPAGIVWAGATTRPAGSACARRARSPIAVVDAATGAVLGDRRARARVLDGARGRRLPPPRRVVPRARARPGRAAPRSSSRSRATTTRSRSRETTTAIEEAELGDRRLGMESFFGRVSVTEQVIAYQRKSMRDQATLDCVTLDLPPTTFETEAIWYVPVRRAARGPRAAPEAPGLAPRRRARA